MQTQLDAVRVAYRLLVDETKIPVNAREVSEAALSSQIDSEGPWAAVRAMARAVNDAHTMLISERTASQLHALVFGSDASYPGFTVHRCGDRFVVGEVTSPDALTAGVRPGDELVSIDGCATRRGFEDLVQLMGKPDGTGARLRVSRAGEARELTMNVTVSWPSLVDSRLVVPRVGYVRLRFVTTSQNPDRDAATLVSRAIAALGGRDLRGLVFDLRSNPGGYGVARVTSVLTDRTPLARYRDAEGNEEVSARTDIEPSCICPIVVLVDDQTLSSAELITLALQDHGVARVVGQPTAGGLSVPRYVSVGDGFVLMTPERLAFGPFTGKASEGRRVQPDVIVRNRTPEDFANGKDPQLDRAVEILTQ